MSQYDVDDPEIRERISSRVNRARVELELRRSLRPLVVCLIGAGIAALGAVFIASNLPGSGGLKSTVEVSFMVKDATAVVAGRDEVRVKGIPAGTITKAQLHRGMAIITTKIYKEYGPIYRDARAALRPNTPIQDMYLDITDRGTPAAGKARASQPLSEDRTSSSVNVSDVLQTFDADARGRLRTLLSQFGSGLDDRGAALRTAFVELTPLLRVANRFSQQVAQREAKTRRLVHSTAALTDELGRRDRQLRTLVSDGGTALRTLQARSGELDATLRELPATLAQMDHSFTALRDVLPDVDGALTGLQPTAEDLPATLASLRRLSDGARPALRALRPSVVSLAPLAGALRPLSRDLSNAVDALRPQTGALSHVTSAVAKCGFTIQRFFQWTQSVFAMGDAHGEGPRGDAAISIDSPGVVSDPGVSEAPACAGGKQIGGRPATRITP